MVTIIIMEAFINKMRRLKGIRKLWWSKRRGSTVNYQHELSISSICSKTVRKYFGEAVVVTQEVDDIISSPIVKETIINNSDCKILLDQRKYIEPLRPDTGAARSDRQGEKPDTQYQYGNNPNRLYKEVWIGLGGTQSAVYATEVSMEDISATPPRKTEKIQVLNKGKAIRRRHRSCHQDARQREEGGCDMKNSQSVPSDSRVLTGFILFSPGLQSSPQSSWRHTRLFSMQAFVYDVITTIVNHLSQWLPL